MVFTFLSYYQQETGTDLSQFKSLLVSMNLHWLLSKSQEILYLLWQVVHNSLSTVSVSWQMNLGHIHTLHFLSISWNIYLQPKHRFIFSHTLFNNIILTISHKKYQLHSSSLRNLFQPSCPITSLGTNTHLSTLIYTTIYTGHTKFHTHTKHTKLKHFINFET